MMKRPLLVLMLAFGMSACSDDGDSSGPAKVVDAKPTGIWRGCLTTILEWELKGKEPNDDFACGDTLGDGQHPMLVVSDTEGRFRIFAEMGVVETYDATNNSRTWTTAPFLARGQVTTKENEANGHLVFYSLIPNNSKSSSIETLKYREAAYQGALTTANRWRGGFTWAGKEGDNLEYFKFDVAYDQIASARGASLSQLEGIWQYLTKDAELETILIEADGSFATEETSSTNGSCLYSGQISVPDPRQNLYRLTNVTIDHGHNGNCTGKNENDFLRGSYGGVAILVEENGIDVLKISLSNETRMLSLDLWQP